MARLSRHPAGPGDPPQGRRKTRNQRKSASVDITSTATAGNKRAASPSAEDVEHQKRIKRVVEEEELSHGAAVETQITTHTTTQVSDTIQVVVDNTTVPRRKVRHSEPGPAIEEEEDSEQEDAATPARPAQLASGLTPHLRRIGADTRPTKSTRFGRQSMPAQLTTIEETSSQQEIQYAPLRDLLNERVKRRLRRSHLSEEVNTIEEHKKQDARDRKELLELREQVGKLHEHIRELEFQKEAARLGNIEIDEEESNEIETALAEANHELAELKASSVFDYGDELDMNGAAGFDSDDDDAENNDTTVLIQPEDLHLSQEDMATEPHPNGYYANIASLENSQLTYETQGTASQWAINESQGEGAVQTDVGDRLSDKAVKRFEAQIKVLGSQLAEAHSALRILAVELQNLHLIEEGATTDQILTALRHTFDDAREELDQMFGVGSVADLNNTELVSHLIDHIRGLMVEIREKTELAENHNRMERALKAQNSAILDMLAEADIRNKELERSFHTADKKTDEQQREIVELETTLMTSQTTSQERLETIELQTKQIASLEDERTDLETTIQRHTQALDSYRKEVASMSDIISNLEQDRDARIAQMEEEHAQEVEDLQTKLDKETAARTAAEEYGEERDSSYASLERCYEKASDDLKEFKAQVSQLEAQLKQEKADRALAEEDRDRRTVDILELDGALSKAKEQEARLQKEVESLRDQLDTERHEREAKEAELVKRNEEIASLETQVHDSGIQANELRSKLFQVQMEKDATIKSLEEEMDAEQDQYQELLETEIQRRTEKQDQIEHLESRVGELSQDLKDLQQTQKALEEERDELIAERDERIQHLESELEDLELKFSRLDQTTKMELTTLQSTIQDLNNAVAERDAMVKELKATAATTTESFETQLDERDATITHLQKELKTKSGLCQELESHVISLEQRVEHEANELLNTQDHHATEVQGLKATIAAQAATIANLQSTAELRAAEHESILAEKNQQLQELELVATTRAADITSLISQIEEMKAQFRIQEEDTRKTMEELQESQRLMLAQNEQLGAALLQRNKDTLKAVEEMRVKGLHIHSSKVDLHKIANGRVSKIKDSVKVGKKGRKTKRQYDSGFGVAEDEDEEVNGDMPEMSQINGQRGIFG